MTAAHNNNIIIIVVVITVVCKLRWFIIIIIVFMFLRVVVANSHCYCYCPVALAHLRVADDTFHTIFVSRYILYITQYTHKYYYIIILVAYGFCDDNNIVFPFTRAFAE